MHRFNIDIVVIPHVSKFGTALEFHDFEAVFLIDGQYKRYTTPAGGRELPVVGNTEAEARKRLNDIIKNTEFYSQAQAD